MPRIDAKNAVDFQMTKQSPNTYVNVIKEFVLKTAARNNE